MEAHLLDALRLEFDSIIDLCRARRWSEIYKDWVGPLGETLAMAELRRRHPGTKISRPSTDKGVDFFYTLGDGTQRAVQVKTTRGAQRAYIYTDRIRPSLLLVAIRLREDEEPHFYVTDDLTANNPALVYGKSKGREYYWVEPDRAK